MRYSDDQFRELEKGLRMSNRAKEQLRTKIVQKAYMNKKNVKPYGIIAAACAAILIVLPYSSPTMASIAEKILPISITPSFFAKEQNSDLISELFDLVEREGYTVYSAGITPSPYTIDISLELKEETLQQATAVLEPLITDYLYKNGYDKYELKLSEAGKTDQHDSGQDKYILYDSVRKIVKDVFASYGYAEEAGHVLAFFNDSSSAPVVSLEVPDYIQEGKAIVEDIKKEIQAQRIDVENIEVTVVDMEERLQENRWALIASDLFDGMAGKSTYQLQGVSFRVDGGSSNVFIKTDFDQPPSRTIIQEIEEAVKQYFALPEVKEKIQNDKYTIQFLQKNGKPFLEIVN